MDPRLRHDFGPLTSVRSAAYDPESGVAEITFKGDKITSYGGFTPELWAEWTSADKPGKWFHERVRLRPASHPEISSVAHSAQLAPSDNSDTFVRHDRDAEPASSAVSADPDTVFASAKPDEPRARPFTTATRPPDPPPAYKSALARARASKKRS